MARERDEREVSERFADEIAARVTASVSAEFDQLRRGLVELAGSVAELHARQQELGDQIGAQTTNAMVKVVEHVEALLAATGWAILDRIRTEGDAENGGSARSHDDEPPAPAPQSSR